MSTWNKKLELVIEKDDSSSEEEAIYDVAGEMATEVLSAPHLRTCLIAAAPYLNSGTVPPRRVGHHEESQKIQTDITSELCDSAYRRQWRLGI